MAVCNAAATVSGYLISAGAGGQCRRKSPPPQAVCNAAWLIRAQLRRAGGARDGWAL